MPASRAIQVVASWQYQGCENKYGKEVIINDLCCNSKCDCKVRGELVLNGQEPPSPIKQWTIDPYNTIAYECSRSEIDDCQVICLSNLFQYLKMPSNSVIDPTRRNWNIIIGDDGIPSERSQQVKYI